MKTIHMRLLIFMGLTLIGIINTFSLQASESDVIYNQIGCDVPNNQSIVDVLKVSGQHTTFLALMETYDLEGYTILSDPELSDKTVWAPVDAAFESIQSDLDLLSDEEIKAILGYHISPPLSRPNGEYPVITWDYLEDNDTQVFRTRTGVLTGSDQRISISLNGDSFEIENREILPTVWCTQSGSVFSIQEVITDVEPPSWIQFRWYRLVRILLYEDIRFIIYATVPSLFIGTGVAFYFGRKK